MKWTVFDLEFTDLLPSGEWPQSLHVACAAVVSADDLCPQVWHEYSGDFMSEETLVAFVDLLSLKVSQGHTIATWGGSASDWRMLMRECPARADAIQALAMDSVDVPMCSCMSIGMMMGLNAACMALGFTLKDSGASASVPELWTHEEGRAKVLQHVSNDAHATMLVIKNATTSGSLPWVTQKGHTRTWDHVRWRSVRACLAEELPKVPFVIGPAHNAKLLARWLLLV